MKHKLVDALTNDYAHPNMATYGEASREAHCLAVAIKAGDWRARCAFADWVEEHMTPYPYWQKVCDILRTTSLAEIAELLEDVER